MTVRTGPTPGAAPPSLGRNPLSLAVGVVAFAVLVSRIALPGTSAEEARALQVTATMGTALGMLITALAIAIRKRVVTANAVVLSPLLVVLAGALIVESADPRTGVGAAVADWTATVRAQLSFGALTLEDLAVFMVAFWVIAAFFVHATCEDRPRVALLAPLAGILALSLIDQRSAPLLHVATDVSLVAGLLAASALDERRRPAYRLRPASRRRAPRRARSEWGVAATTTAFAAGSVAAALLVAAVAGTTRTPVDLLPPGIGASSSPASYEPFVDIHQQLVELDDRRLLSVTFTDPADTAEYLVMHRLPFFTGEGFVAGPGDRPTMGTRRIAHAVDLDELSGAAPAVSGPIEASRPIDPATGTLEADVPDSSYTVISAGTVRPGLDPIDPSLTDPEPGTVDLGGLDGFFRIRERAAAVAGAGSTGEQLMRLEQHLRSDPARYVIPERRTQVDLEAWILDDGATGYCEQFAIAMAVMARSIGIPSRIVTGFVPGVGTDGSMTVTGADAHAWVEAWVEGYGWVPFDPTPRGGASMSAAYAFPQAPSTADEPDPADPGIGTAAPRQDEGSSRWFAAWPAIAALGCLLALLGVGAVARKREVVRLAEEGDVPAAWAVTMLRLRAYGRPARPSQTPIEVAAETTERLRPLATAYTKVTYGQALLDDVERTAATDSMRATDEELRRSTTWWRRTTRSVGLRRRG